MRRVQTTKERALEFVREAFGECMECENHDEGIVSVTICAEVPPCRGMVKVVDVSARSANAAWSKAMRAARKRVEAEILLVDQQIAKGELAVIALRDRRKRIITTLNSDGTVEVP